MATAVNRSGLLPGVQRQPFAIMSMWLTFLVFYIIAFPKGGIKAAGVPLTIGYVLTSLLLVTALLRAGSLALPFDRLLAFAPCLLLGLWSALVVYVNGTDVIGFTISYFISVLYLPAFGLIFFSSLVLDEHHENLEKAFMWAVRFIVVYGIFLFVFRQTTGKWIEIPYITVNAGDVGQLDDKYINRGGVYKLISTYNNGNIFGVSLAIIAPLYLKIEPRKVASWLLYLAMFLTLSRTVWIGAVLVILLGNLSKGVRPLSVLYLTIGLLIAGISIVSLLNFIGRDTSFILDSNLGGRAGQLDYLSDIRLVPEGQVSALPEIVYLGMIKYFGLPGFLLFLIHLVTPSVLLSFEGVRLLSVSRASACLQGLAIYVVLASADAAFSFIPVMMIFWMVAGMGFWYAHCQARLRRGAREASR